MKNLAAVFSDKNNSRTQSNDLEHFTNNLHIQILGHGRRQEPPSLDRVENFMFPAFLLVQYEQGSTTLKHNGKTMVLKPGSLYIFNSFELYTGHRNTSEPLAYKYVYFDIVPISSRSIFRKYAFGSEDSYFDQEWFKTVGSGMINDAYDTVKNDEEHQELLLQFALRGIISYIIYSHYQHATLPKRLHPNKSTLLIDQAFSYTSKHMNQPINISKMVRVLGTSRSTIDRVFLDTLQMTPSRALTRYKMQQSLALLQSGTSVKETSQVLGYSSTFHFSNTFKMVFGKSPRKYLESL